MEELLQHLQEWKSPLFVNVHIDDTIIKHRIEYDETTGRFVGFILPIKNRLPECHTFVLDTFDDIKHAFENQSIAKYAHCVVARSVDVKTPSFVLFVMGTDSKYDHQYIPMETY